MLSRIEDNWKGQDQNWNMREQTFDSTNAAPSPFSCATSLQAAATIRLSFLDRGWTMDMLIVKSMKMNTTLSPGTSREVFSSVRYTVYQHLEVLLERHGWINTICLVFLWRTEPKTPSSCRWWPSSRTRRGSWTSPRTCTPPSRRKETQGWAVSNYFYFDRIRLYIGSRGISLGMLRPHWLAQTPVCSNSKYPVAFRNNTLAGK